VSYPSISEISGIFFDAWEHGVSLLLALIRDGGTRLRATDENPFDVEQLP